MGRATQLADLRAEWRRATDGESRVAWVVGEPGIGKTALVRRLVAEIDGHQVIWVTADESERSLSYALLAQARSLLRVGGGVGGTDGGRREWGIEPFEVGAALLADLGTVEGSLVLVFDDLQWADPLSAAALLFALRRLEGDAALVVLVTRQDAGEVLGPSWVRFLLDEHRVRRFALGGLDAAEVGELAEALGAGRLDLVATERLRQHTGGHPLHTSVLLAELDRRELTRPSGVLPAPRSLVDLTLARLGALPTPAQRFVEAGAVLGTTFSLVTAAGVGGIVDAPAALEAAMAAGVLDRAGAGDAVFTHPLLRGAVYHDLSPTRLRQLHAAAADLTSGLAALRHRVDAAGGATEHLAAELEDAARRELATGGVTTAADLLQSAARLTPDPHQRDQRTLSAAEALLQGGYYDRARELRATVEACAPGPLREHVLALTDIVSGAVRPAVVRFRAAVEQATIAAQPDVRSRALAGMAFAHWLDSAYERACEAADRALRGNPGWAGAVTFYVRALCLLQLGRAGEVWGADAPAGISDVDVLATRGLVHLYDDNLVDAISALTTVVRLCRQGESSPLFLLSLGNLAEAEFLHGRWDDATVHAELAVSLATDTEELVELVRAHAVAAEVDAGRGRLGACRAHLAAADALVTQLPSWGRQAAVAMARASLAQVTGDARGMRAAVEPLLDEVSSAHLVGHPGWRWRVLVVEAHLGAGEMAAAAASLAGLAAVVEQHGREQARADLARLQGMLAEAAGQPDAAQHHYGAVDEPAEGTPPLSVARLRLADGTLLRRRGDRRRATAQLRRAHEILTGLGAAPYLEKCTSELAACGLRAGADGRRDTLALTPRQEAVALLIAGGLTNREAAAELYLSCKAVEYHLGHIYAKLGISSRRELAGRIL